MSARSVLWSLALVPAPPTLVHAGEPADPSALPAASVDSQRAIRIHNAGQTTGDPLPNMIFVPGSTFTQGITEKQLRDLCNVDNEKFLEWLVAMYPDHLESVQGFFADQYEVTNREYRAFLDSARRNPNESIVKYVWQEWRAGTQITNVIPAGAENKPVHCVSFYEAQDYARAHGKRLPTEMEWEYMARMGLPEDQFFPWGKTWDNKQCCNSANSAPGGKDPSPRPVGSFAGDKTALGLFDLAGNVMEWTDSEYTAYPGFAPLKFKKRPKGEVTITGRFRPEDRACRGGNYLGDDVSNNLIIRSGNDPKNEVEGIGIRCVVSELPGFDQLRQAGRVGLAVISGDIRSRIDFSRETMVAQTIQEYDKEKQRYSKASHVALASASKVGFPFTRLKKESIEVPELVAILTTSEPILDPPLPPGSYGVYFKGEGESAAMELAREKREEEEKEAAKNRPDRKPRKDKESGKDAEDPEKGDTPEEKEGDKKEGEKKEEELTPEEKAERELINAELEKIGARETSVGILVQIPADTDVLLFRNAGGQIAGFLPVTWTEVKPLPTTLAYSRAGELLSSNPKAIAQDPPGTNGKESANDTAVFEFSLKTAGTSLYPRMTMKIEFAAGTFAPIDPVVLDKPR